MSIYIYTYIYIYVYILYIYPYIKKFTNKTAVVFSQVFFYLNTLVDSDEDPIRGGGQTNYIYS